MRFRNREVIKRNGYTFSIMQWWNGQWNLVLEGSNRLKGNKVFTAREECLRFIEEYTK